MEFLLFLNSAFTYWMGATFVYLAIGFILDYLPAYSFGYGNVIVLFSGVRREAGQKGSRIFCVIIKERNEMEDVLKNKQDTRGVVYSMLACTIVVEKGRGNESG